MKNCPLCGEDYNQYPALSRVLPVDICPTCGTTEAMIPQNRESYLQLWSNAQGITPLLKSEYLEKIKEKLKNRAK